MEKEAEKCPNKPIQHDCNQHKTQLTSCFKYRISLYNEISKQLQAKTKTGKSNHQRNKLVN